MNILIDAYNTSFQNPAGGVQMRIKSLKSELEKKGFNVKLFNKWEDKIKDFDVLHMFKLNIDCYSTIMEAKKNKLPVVISSIVPLISRRKIQLNYWLNKYGHINTGNTYGIFFDIIKNANAIISQTVLEANFLENIYRADKSKVYVIPNGVNCNLGKGDPELIKKNLGLKEEFVLQVGIFESNKNQLRVIKAMKNTNIPIVFIGGPSKNEPEYLNQCKREANSSFYFLGWVESHDPLLASAYTAAKVNILPSIKEIFGNALIEGGAAGANLVSTNVLPIKDWGIDSFTEVIDPLCENDIRNAIIRAYQKTKNPNTSKIIREKFSWENVTGSHINIYEKVHKN